jgi:hypothetical protein
MKNIIAIALLVVPFFSQADNRLPNTKYEVKMDQTAYERVFIKCVDAFKGPEKTTFNDLDEAIEACEKAARKIAMRSPYATGDASQYYVTAVPEVSEHKEVEKK